MRLSKYNCMYGKTQKHHLDSLIFHQFQLSSEWLYSKSGPRHVGYVQVLMHYAKAPPGVQRFLKEQSWSFNVRYVVMCCHLLHVS